MCKSCPRAVVDPLRSPRDRSSALALPHELPVDSFVDRQFHHIHQESITAIAVVTARQRPGLRVPSVHRDSPCDMPMNGLVNQAELRIAVVAEYFFEMFHDVVVEHKRQRLLDSLDEGIALRTQVVEERLRRDIRKDISIS
jgi:hypothetical protein